MRALPESPRLVFREFTADDLDALAGLLADPQVMRFSWHGPRDRAGSRVALAAFQRSYREGSGAGKWALELRATGEFVGYCGFEPCPAGSIAKVVNRARTNAISYPGGRGDWRWRIYRISSASSWPRMKP